MANTPTVTQLFEGEKLVYNESKSRVVSATIFYKVTGASAEGEAISSASAQIPGQAYGIGLRKIEIEERLAPDVWKVHAEYQLSSGGTLHPGGRPAEIVTYSNVMHSTRRYHSMYTVHSYSVGSVVDYHGQIDVQDGEAQGVDVYFPVATMNVSHFFTKSQMGTEFRNRLLRQKPVVNSEVFRGFEAGELLFGGVNLSQPPDSAYWRADFTFLISPNDSDVEIADWSGGTIEKDGWDALWIAYRESYTDRGVKRPAQVNVEQVYHSLDFAEFGLSARG